MNRFLSFINRHWLKNTAYLFWYVAFYFVDGFRLRLNFYTQIDLYKEIESGKSYLRFGDGEVYLINFGSIGYQEYVPELQTELLEMGKNYSLTSEYIIGLPQVDMNKSNDELRKIGRLELWLPMKIFIRRFLPLHLPYGDAHVFYYSGFRTHLLSWIENKHLIIITNPHITSSIDTRHFRGAKRVSFIHAPEKNAYIRKNDIISEVKALLHTYSEDRFLLLIAAGPLSKSLVYYFSTHGIQAIDLGIGIELLGRLQDQDMVREIKATPN